MVDAKAEYGYTSTSVHEETKAKLEQHKADDESWTDFYERLLDAYEGDVSDRTTTESSPNDQSPTLEEVQELVKDARVVHSRVLTKYDGTPEELEEPLETLTETLQALAETVNA